MRLASSVREHCSESACTLAVISGALVAGDLVALEPLDYPH